DRLVGRDAQRVRPVRARLRTVDDVDPEEVAADTAVGRLGTGAAVVALADAGQPVAGTGRVGVTAAVAEVVTGDDERGDAVHLDRDVRPGWVVGGAVEDRHQDVRRGIRRPRRPLVGV